MNEKKESFADEALRILREKQLKGETDTASNTEEKKDDFDAVLRVIRKARLKAEAKTALQRNASAANTDRSKHKEQPLLVAMTHIHFKGAAGKLYIPMTICRFLRENKINHVKLITSPLGGIIVLQPLSNAEVSKLYNKGRKIYEDAISR